MTARTYISAAGNEVTRQRAEQLRHPDRYQARAAVYDAMVAGRIPPPRTLKCADCKKAAQEYDHFKGYARVNRLAVQPVCRKCHVTREKLRRGACRRGHPYTLDTTYITKGGYRHCRTCRDEGKDTNGTKHHTHGSRGEGYITSWVRYEEDERAVDALLAAGYAPSKSECLRRALREVAERVSKTRSMVPGR